MAACGAFLAFLLVCLPIIQPTSARNDAPCEASKWNNGFITFTSRHLPYGAPNSEDYSVWEKFIRSLGGCDRPTQSFLKPEDLDEVKSVCTRTGGKVLKENLCISQKPFTFITVRSEKGTCGIKSVKKETKHLILACEVLENQCVPVHFEGNPQNLKPDNNAKSCQNPKGHAVGFHVSIWLLLFSFSIYVF